MHRCIVASELWPYDSYSDPLICMLRRDYLPSSLQDFIHDGSRAHDTGKAETRCTRGHLLLLHSCRYKALSLPSFSSLRLRRSITCISLQAFSSRMAIPCQATND